MAKIKGAVVVNTERCKGCNLCVVACPSGQTNPQLAQPMHASGFFMYT